MDVNDMQEAPLGLAESVARRICHDFAGLLSTLDGLTELAAEEPEAAVLARETARRLAARLRLVRGAWGGGGDELTAAAIADMAQGLPGAERLHVMCDALAQPLDGVAARLCLSLLLAGAGAMPRGGTLRVGSAETGFWVEMEGPRAAWPEGLAGAGVEAPLDPRGLPVALCRMLAAAAGWRIVVDAGLVVARGP